MDTRLALWEAHFPLWTRTPETSRFLAQQEALLRKGVRRGNPPDRDLVEHFTRKS